MGTAKNWSYSAGERGRNRVRAYEDPKSGTILLEYYEQEPGAPKPRRKRKGLGHRDRKRAKQQADEIAAAFGRAISGLRSRSRFDACLTFTWVK